MGNLIHTRARRHVLLARVAIGGLLLLAVYALSACGQTYKLRGTPYEPIIPAPEIRGVNQDGAVFELSKLDDRVKVIFFGYTFCPDVCPLTLSNMKGVYEQLSPEEQAKIAVVFITIDPARDTPERLKTYVGAFNPNFYGVQLQDDELLRVKGDYGVYAEKRVLESSQSAADYLMDHTAFVYVIDKDNNLREIFSNDAPKEDIAADVSYLVRQ